MSLDQNETPATAQVRVCHSTFIHFYTLILHEFFPKSTKTNPSIYSNYNHYLFIRTLNLPSLCL